MSEQRIEDGLYLVEFTRAEERKGAVDLVIESSMDAIGFCRLTETFSISVDRKSAAFERAKFAIYKSVLGDFIDLTNPESFLFQPFVARIVKGRVVGAMQVSDEMALPRSEIAPRPLKVEPDGYWDFENIIDPKRSTPPRPWETRGSAA